MTRKTALAGLMALAASACTPSLATFNRFVPHDSGAHRVAQGASFGPGPRQALDVYAPRVAPTNAPVIVFLYGGSWNSGSRSDYAFIGDAFASRGFVTVIPDYRIAPDVFPSFVEDGALTLKWVREHIDAYGGDPDRIVLVGHSAGAYTAVMLALDAHYLRNAGVDVHAVRGVAGLAGPYDFLPFDVASTQAAFAAYPDPQATQPLHFARGDAPPLFLGWGDGDTLVGRRSIVNLGAAIRAHGGVVETKIYPRVAHVALMLALSKPLRGRAPVLVDVIVFARQVASS